MKRTKVRELLREELLSMLANSKRNDKLREPPIRISEGRLLRIVQEEIAREVDKISDSRDLLYEATYEEYTGEDIKTGKTMKKGHGGKLVKIIQASLGVKADGKFGPKTEKALAAEFDGAVEIDRKIFGELSTQMSPKLRTAMKKVVVDAAAEKKAKAAAEKAKAASDKAVGEKAVAAHKTGEEEKKKAATAQKTKSEEAEKIAIAGFLDTSLKNHDLNRKIAQKKWNLVTSADRRKAKKDPTSTFIYSLAGFGTDRGECFAALYYAGGFKGIKTNSRLYKDKFGTKSPEIMVKKEMSGDDQDMGTWLGSSNLPGKASRYMKSDGSWKDEE